MKKRSAYVHQVSVRMGLQNEQILKKPIVEVFGNSRVIVENHQGVKHFSDCEILVSSNCGTYSICGNGLCIAKMSQFQLVIIGKIESVNIFREFYNVDP